MEAILALQKQLAAVQEQTQTARLSDRNIVEIIDNLIKNYEFKLIYTQDGREYLTPEHLERQIKDVVIEHGRINIVELPKILNVGIERIEPRVDVMCKKGAEVINMNGQLLTHLYLDDIAEEINEELQQRHKVPISDISLKFNIAHEFLIRALTQRLDTVIQGQIQGNFLVTKSYQNVIKSQLRGVLRGSVKPLAVSQIKKLYGIDEAMINTVIEELIASQEISGSLRQGAFISNRFLENQEKIITKFFRQNSYIEYDMLQKSLYVQKPKELLQQLFKDDCIFLQNCCFNKNSLEHTKEQIVETLNTEGSIDVTNLLPSILEEEEIETIITQYLGLEDYELSGYLIISNSFLDKCTTAFKEKIIENIYKAPQKLIAEEEEPKKKGGKGKKKKGESEELFSLEEVVKQLKDSKLLTSDYDPDFEESLYKLLKERLVKYSKVIQTELFENKKNSSSELINDIQSKLEERISTVAFIDKNIENIQTRNTAVDVNFAKNKLSGYMRPIVENMILLYCRKYSIHIAPTLLSKNEEKKEADMSNAKRIRLDESPMFKSQEAIASIIDSLPKDLMKLMKQFNDLIVQKKVHEANEFLQKNALDLGIKPVSLDKKSEKNFIYAQRYYVKEDIAGARHDPRMQFFYQLILLGLEQGFFLGMDFDEKAVSTYCSVLLGESSLNEEAKKEIQKAMSLYNETDEGKVKEFESINSKLKGYLSK